MNDELELMESRSKENTLGKGYYECKYLKVLKYRCSSTYDGFRSQ